MRKAKNKIIRGIETNSFRRTSTGRLELMLALMGWGCSMTTLTFSNQTLPETFPQVREWWRACSKSMRKFYGGAFPYVYAIEGLHGDHRWHVHVITRDEDFSESDFLRHWGGGTIEDVQPLLSEVHRSFFERAYYLTKERRDGVRIPKGVKTWVASPMLYPALPPAERRVVKSGSIRVPKDVWSDDKDDKKNDYGAYTYRSWIQYP